MLLLDTPTLAHIPDLLAGFADGGPFAKYHQVGSKDYVLKVVYHLCGDDVLEDERYKSFMNQFGPDVHVSGVVASVARILTTVQHLIASRKHLPDPVTFTSAAYSQLRLNQLDPTLFPLPEFTLDAEKSLQGTLITTTPALRVPSPTYESMKRL